jgi:hypothetical protein
MCISKELIGFGPLHFSRQRSGENAISTENRSDGGAEASAGGGTAAFNEV